MVYCLNFRCPNPHNPDDAKFCSRCGQKLWLGDRFTGLSLMQQGVKGRTLLAIDHGTMPPSQCIIKQAAVTASVMADEFLATFRHNVAQLQKLGDRPEFPGVLASFIPNDLLDPNQLPTVVFEKIDGETLLQRMNAAPKFKEDEVKAFLLQVLPLLEILHDHQLVHRDLSPGNFIFTPANHWAIVDCTAAKVTSKMASAQPGTLIGSGVYTAPEQLRGQSFPASDLYSLGVICLEMLTQMHPFELQSLATGEWIWRDYLKTPPSEEFCQLLDSLVAEKVGDRPQSAQAVLEYLGAKPKSQPKAAVVADLPAAAPRNKHETTLPTLPERSPTITPEENWFCYKILRGHSGYVTALSFDHTGKYLASGAADQTIRIWNVELRGEVKCLRGHQGIVSAVVFLDDQVISGSWDYSVRIWDWQRGIEGDRLEQRQSWIRSLTLLDNDHQLATLGADEHIALWDLKTKTFLSSWDSLGSKLLHADAISPVLLSANDQEIYLWQGDRLLSTLAGHLSKITAFQISANGKFIITAADDHCLRLWSVQNQQCDQILHAAAPVQAIAIFPDKRFFAAGDSAGTLYIWQVGQEEPLATIQDHQGAIQAIAVSPDSKIIATGGQDKTIKLWRFGIQ